jgi:hypothetical protein
MRKTLLVLPFAVVFLLTPPRDPARISTIMRDVRAMFAATAAAPGPAATPALALPASATDVPAPAATPLVQPSDITLTPNTACPPGYYSSSHAPGCQPFSPLTPYPWLTGTSPYAPLPTSTPLPPTAYP